MRNPQQTRLKTEQIVCVNYFKIILTADHFKEIGRESLKDCCTNMSQSSNIKLKENKLKINYS